MSLQLKQSLKQTQKLLMTPQLQQAIKLLQLSHHELEQVISKELAENPLLEIGEKSSLEEESLSNQLKEDSLDQFTKDDNKHLTDLFDSSEISSPNPGDNVEIHSTSNNDDPEGSSPSQFDHSAANASRKPSSGNSGVGFESFTPGTISLSEHVRSQFIEFNFSMKEQEIAEHLLGNIDEKGFLDIELNIIAEELDATLDDVEGVLDCLQRVEPAGLFARDLQECYLIQIREKKLKNGVLEKIVANHFNDITQQNYAAIAKALDISQDDVIKNIKMIRHLRPHPALDFVTGENELYITPDVYIYKISGKWVININEDGIPPLTLNDDYLSLTKKNHVASNSETNQYINEKAKSAQWLIRSLYQRQITILKVSESILKKQIDFFEKGIEYLLPLVLKDIAEEIGMSESTISRVTSNKYMHTPRGVFELKYFFNSSITTSDGANMASEAVKVKIAAVIKSENPNKPYSDQQLVELLAKTGINLARRTVAKYREQLNILPSSQRRRVLKLEA